MSIFSHVAVKGIRHNTFDLSHERKFSGGMGMLIPCFLAETVPNDTFNISTSQLLRFAPLVAPVMHRFSIYTHFFFVPNRICWENWEDFINGGRDGDADPTFPTYDTSGASVGATMVESSLADYLGVPVEQGLVSGDGLVISAIPFYAYNKIWYEFYRDQNLYPEQDYLKEPMADGPQWIDGLSNLYTKFRAWQHDYFTSALPWTQRGPEATIPLGNTADINFLGWDGLASNIGFSEDATNSTTGDLDVEVSLGSTGTASAPLRINDGGTRRGAIIDNSGNLEVDLTTATAASINDLRRAFRLQEWLELNARGGARYNETIKVHFGISPGDSRLQRPEFLGGSSTPIVVSEVLQTSSNDSEPTPQGNMAGHGISVGGKNITKYKCREHGYIIGIMSVMPKTAYQQGIAKHWFKFDKFDYFWRSFANIGEQAILNKEVYVDTTDGEDDNIFGYTPRYAEYKYINDSVHGAFRSSLDFWHDGRIFAARPNLNSAFIACTPQQSDRIFAVQETFEQFYCQMHHKVKARRPMPYFGLPTI